MNKTTTETAIIRYLLLLSLCSVNHFSYREDSGCPAACSSPSYCFLRPFRYIRKLSGSSLEFLAACRSRLARWYLALCCSVSGSQWCLD